MSLLVVRLMLMGFSAPEFSPSDNPASDSPCYWTRVMTFAFLPALNFYLLLCPVSLGYASHSRLDIPWLVTGGAFLWGPCFFQTFRTCGYYEDE